MNLADACNKLAAVAQASAAAEAGATAATVVEAVVAAAEAYFKDDIATCKVWLLVAQRIVEFEPVAHHPLSVITDGQTAQTVRHKGLARV